MYFIAMTPKNIYKFCGDFSSRVSQITPLKIHDKVLSKLTSLKSFDERNDVANEHWEKLGEGSARAVYRISKDLIIKIAINDKGLLQNKVEMKVDLQVSCAIPVIVADPNGKWLITYFSEDLTKEKFKDITGFGFDMFMNSLFYAYNNESDNKKPKEYDQIKNHLLFKCLGKMIIDANLLIGDLQKPSTFGIRNNKVYIRDYGFNKDVYEKEYNSGSNSSSSSSTTKTSS